MKLSTLVKKDVLCFLGHLLHHHLVTCLEVQEGAFHKLLNGWVVGLRAAVVISLEHLWVPGLKDVVKVIQLTIMRDYKTSEGYAIFSQGS